MRYARFMRRPAGCNLVRLTCGLAMHEPLKCVMARALGVCAPMHRSEQPVLRPYWLVVDIGLAMAAAVQAGATVMVAPMAIPDYGMCAIYAQGGNHHGLWQR
jgi:predicted enzyme related to lactoylglutathione lyase